ncbi:hypothetical protein JCM19233_5403 [Vibrio astriarenae]|nr:hypothetical protein JCM19233_5403 [Vibrio sp. C7]
MGDVQSQLRNLNTIASRGKSVSYAMANVTERFNALYVGVAGHQAQGLEHLHSVEAYQAQGDALRETAQSSLELANQMSQYQDDDAQTLSAIQGHVSGANGAMEVAQAQGELLAQISQQLQKLQTLMQAQIQMQSTYIAQQVDNQERDRVTQEKVMSQPLEVNGNDGEDWSTQWHSHPSSMVSTKERRS